MCSVVQSLCDYFILYIYLFILELKIVLSLSKVYLGIYALVYLCTLISRASALILAESLSQDRFLGHRHRPFS